jgi:D-glycero-D-manno-heptose 1,7-bisphosphate phosphatase
VALRPAVFLDKDGTLVEDVPYNVDPARMTLAPGAAAALERLDAHGYALIVVSNQSGVARGMFGEDALAEVAARLRELVSSGGATLADFVYCPHHPGGSVPEYARVCSCRKPAPGMLERAALRNGVALGASWMVGDILDDIEAGRRAGCRTVLIDNGNETEWRTGPERTPHHVVASLEDAAAAIVSRSRAANPAGRGSA